MWRSRASAGVLAFCAAGTALAGLYDATVMGDNPVAYWRLGEAPGSPTVADLTGHGHTGTPLNGVLLGQLGALLGDLDTAARFDGSNDKIDVAFAAALNPPSFTVECWARVMGGAGNYRSPITSRDDAPQRGYIFYAEPGNRWQFWTGRTAGGWHQLNGPGAGFGEWYHLVGTYDGATQTKRFYVNGSLMATAVDGVNPNTARPLRIGAGATEGGGNYWFNGLVDEVAVYDTVLSPDRIADHYRAGRFGALVPGRDLLLADFRNPSGSGLGADAAAMQLAGMTGTRPTLSNPHGMLVMGGGGSGGAVFVDALGDFAFDRGPLVVATQAFYLDHNAPSAQSNAFFGLIALHRKGTAASGPDRKGGLWAQFEPLTTGTGLMRIGFQSDATSGQDLWVDNVFTQSVSGFTNANGVFDLSLFITGLDRDDTLRFLVSQGAFQAAITTTLGQYMDILGARSADALAAFQRTLADLVADPSSMDVGFLSTDARNDAYNYLFVTVAPEPATLTLLGLGAFALVARRRRAA